MACAVINAEALTLYTAASRVSRSMESARSPRSYTPRADALNSPAVLVCTSLSERPSERRSKRSRSPMSRARVVRRQSFGTLDSERVLIHTFGAYKRMSTSRGSPATGASSGFRPLTASVQTVASPVTDLVSNDAFRDALFVGAAVSLVCVALALVPTRRHPRTGVRTRFVAGEAVCLGSLAVFWVTDFAIPRYTSLVAGLGCLAIAGLIARRRPLGVRLVTMIPGAVLIASTTASGTVRAVVFTAVLLGGAAVVEWPRWHPASPAGPALLAITALGVYGCVPDTERAVVVLGVAATIGCTGWPVRVTAVGSAGAAAFVGLVAWLAGTDGIARTGSVVGASACVGVLAFVPVLRWSGARLDHERATLERSCRGAGGPGADRGRGALFTGGRPAVQCCRRGCHRGRRGRSRLRVVAGRAAQLTLSEVAERAAWDNAW